MSPERSPLRKSRHGNQSFRKLVKKFNDVGLPFTDDQFRSADTSVYSSTSYKCQLDVGRIVWKRPKELPGENQDGQVTLLPSAKWSAEDFLTLFCFDGPNRWLIAAALALAQHRSLLHQLIHLDEEHFRRTGIVKLTIWQFGTAHKVVIDDKLPADSDDQLLFTRPLGAAKSAYWLPLLEKGYAKLFGSYEALAANGSLASALADLTAGGSVQTVALEANSHAELMGKELALKSLVLLKTKDFTTKAGAFGLLANRYYLVRHLKKNSSSSGTLARLTSKSATLVSSESASPSSSNSPSIQLVSTIYEPPRSSSSFSGPKLQELTIPANEIPKHFESLTICRPYATNKERMHRLTVSSTVGLQVAFDVHPTAESSSEPALDVVLTLAQKSLISPLAIGFRVHSVELNRRYKVHDFGSIKLVASFDPVASRYHHQTIRLPAGRYLLTPIVHQEVPLMISVCAAGQGTVGSLMQLTADMPRYQPVSFMSPKYPVCVSRLVVHSVEGLENQDRFGSANPYIILRHGGKVIKSTVQADTLNPKWDNLVAIFYQKKAHTPIQVEVWHRNLLMDYFVGLVKLMPVPGEGDNDDIESKHLLDKKGVNSRPGVLRYQLTTYEDLKRF